MKTRFLRSWKLVIVLEGLILAVGGLSGPGLIAVAEEPAPPDVPNAVSAAQSAPQPAVPTPPDVKLSPGATEIAKLAQAGLAEDVMLAYVGNVNSSFNLGSDQIVYLNDLGVSGTVVKAMIQRDAQLTSDAQAWAAANQQPVTPPSTPPAAPEDGSYASAPQDNLEAVNPGDIADNANPGDYETTDDTGYFYNSLAPYGNWIHVVGAGLCWQPTVYVGNHGWQPYLDRGRWMNTDCGWYWQSDYSWGWAAFHYGRWFNDGKCGWVWRPDRVWGPAWVSWRRSTDYCGWAPLPPSAHFVPGTGFLHHGHAVSGNHDFGLRASQYTFIPIGRLTDYSPYRYAAASSQANELYHQSMAINHVTFEHNRVVSHGIDPKQVAMASGIEVRTAEIHETPRSPNSTTLSDHLAKRGDSLLIYHPQLPSPAGTTRPRQFFTPPTRSSAAPKTSLINSDSSASGSLAVVGVAPAQHPGGPLPKMNFASAAPGSQVAKTEFYPSGSLIVIGEKPGNHPSPATTGHLPNMNLTYLASQPGATYQSVSPRVAYEPSQHDNQMNRGTWHTTAPQEFGGYHQEPVSPQHSSGESQAVIASHFTAASRLDNHSAYAVYGSTHSESIPQHHQFEPAHEAASTHHSTYVESHAAPAQHFTEHSAPAAVSHSSSSSSSSSFSSSGHR